jgi:hypothetical protein
LIAKAVSMYRKENYPDLVAPVTPRVDEVRRNRVLGRRYAEIVDTALLDSAIKT